MILEMRRALEELGKGKHQGYRKLYDATYEEVYCRSLLILQSEKQAADFMETFYAALFRCVGDLAVPEKPEHWFWQKYYHEMRKEYHHLLSAQGKGQHCGKSTLAAVPAALPFLHRILLMMSFRDPGRKGRDGAWKGEGPSAEPDQASAGKRSGVHR